MDKQYFIVSVKCGHVGRNNYIVKDFPIVASTAKEAATMARYVGRAKHHLKDAIVNVERVSEDLYMVQEDRNQNDPYFSCKNAQDQRTACPDIDLFKMVLEKHPFWRRRNRDGGALKRYLIDQSKKKEAVKAIQRYKHVPLTDI